MAWYDQVDSTKKQRLGTRKRDVAGNEYIYLKGVSSVVAGDVVAFDEAFVTTRLLQATIGRIAVAQAAVDSTSEYGWFMIYGTCSANVAASFAADQAGLYATSTPGVIDDSGAGGEEFIYGMLGRSAIASSQATVEMSYPFKTAATLD